ncbi:MAG TPA: hypothetical protein VHV75_09960 [Solirubrobacteraceae bacterium]|jgi:DNA replication protein DnaC|nr:hypothetical protein [Solirubrobacteraceae bacterium]
MTDIDVINGQCAGCDKPMTREVPASATGGMAKVWRSATFWCDECGERRQQERDQAALHERLVARVDASGLPVGRRQMLADLSHSRPVLDMCQAWVRGEILGLMLTGPVGTGKTTLAGAAVFELLATRPVLWAPLGTFFARLGLPFEHEGRRWAIEVVDGNHGLAFDDLDKARNTEFGREQVFTAIDHRIEHGLPLIITSNMDMDEIATRFGDAVASRLAGYCALVVVDGPDRRLGAAQASNRTALEEGAA